MRDQIPPGPFTKPEDVNSSMEDIPESKDKNNRMFMEIGFQKNTSAAMRKKAEMFRMEKNRQNLDISDYASNLYQYLDQARGYYRTIHGWFTILKD